MLPLAATAFPDSSQALRTAILGGFREYGIEAREVVVEGADFPKIGLLRIDLTGAKATRELRIPHPGPLQSGKIEAERVEIDARPLFLETMPVRIEIRAEKAAFSEAQAEGGAGSLLALQQAGEGRLEMEIRKADLEELLQSVAVAAAAERGVEIKETHLELTSRGKRALTFRAEVIAKMFLMKAPVSLTGNLDLDEDLNLQISQLTLGGSAMITGIVSKFARPHFERLEAAPIALSALSLAGVKLREIELTAGEAIHLQARFGQ